MITVNDVLIRIAISCFLGGLIGMERESLNRPAGFRTHILVCIGSALVMMTGIFIFEKYHTLTTLDPTRLGAQVVSGIGFLGAGTILREGLTVRGLTTAASLWAVACIGLATGSGFYIGSITGTILVFIILFFFSNIEKKLSKKHNEVLIKVVSISKPGQIGKIGTQLGMMNVGIINIKLANLDDTSIVIELTLKLPRHIAFNNVIEGLLCVDGVQTTEIIE